jgi:hypothetical protein
MIGETHRFDALVVPCLYLTALCAIEFGNTFQLSGYCCCTRHGSTLNKVGSIFKLAGSAISFTAGSAQFIADTYARAAAVRVVVVPIPILAADRTTRALDYPASTLQLITSALFVSTNSAAVAAAFGTGNGGAARILIVVASATSFISTLLHFASEIHRTLDIAMMIRQLRNSGVSIDDAQLRSAQVTAVVESFDLNHSAFDSCACHGVGFALFLSAASPFVLTVVTLNLSGSSALVTGALLLITNNRIQALIAIQVSFALYILGLCVALKIGASKIASHRRGGRAHLCHDLEKAERRGRS